ncbi:MAG: hydantoinase B/oxoprolinase family protein [Chloroflexi bacterium]|nr:hydantoinase B/oxoprolinase family protein [Chloroflexota bacterium]
MAQLDPITLEVLRHRLWMINDEQGKVATQISGSPVVYEAYDFNSSLITPQGDSLFVGVYTTRLSLSLHLATKHIIANMSDNPGFEDGDAFVTNDPWAGASHMNDFLMLAPVFWEGEIVAWSGIAMHEVDVGGPNPGSFTVGAKDVYGEGPVIPPIKLVERGRVRKDIEGMVIRNTRTPELNALDIRARLAAINRTRQRVHEIIRQYGKDTFLAAQAHIMELARRGFARRLLELPDGTWCDRGFIDHDGNENKLYEFRLAMTKAGDRLTFDYTGTSPQAPGMINCTRVGLEGGTMSAVLPMLCYDMPWCPGGVMNQIDIVSEEGAINNARHPAAVSMATVAAAFATGQLACTAIARMLDCTEKYHVEAQAGGALSQFYVVAGYKEDGQRFTGILLDQGPGGGARTYKDGMDVGGVPGSPCQGIGNVETYERLYPVLYLYRKLGRDTAGAGTYRGGAGTELMIIPHRTRQPLDMTMITHGASHPDARGLYGGMPSSVNVRLCLRGSNARQLLAAQLVPAGLEDVTCEKLESRYPKDRFDLQLEDALLMGSCGGGGYGDPLERSPDLVARDVTQGLVSREVALHVYGVVLDPVSGKADTEDTAHERHRLRQLRLLEAVRPAATSVRRGDPPGRPYLAGNAGRPIATCLKIVRRGDPFGKLRAGPAGRPYLACARCGHIYGEATEDPKMHAATRQIPITVFSPWNRFGMVEHMVGREAYCPKCALLIGVQVGRKADPPFSDMLLRL